MTCILITYIWKETRWHVVVTGFLNCETSSSREGLGFESGPEDLASCVKFFLVFFFQSLTADVGQYKMEYGPIFPHYIRFASHSYRNICHYVTMVGKQSLKSGNQESRTASFSVLICFCHIQVFTRDFSYLNLCSFCILFLTIKSTTGGQADCSRSVLMSSF